MDETAIYLGHHGRKTTLDRRGVASVPCNASGYESTRMTCILGYRRDGTKLAPMLVAKGETVGVDRIEGVEVMHSPKAWSTHKVLTKWVQRALPRVSRQGTRRTRYAALVWDAAPTHRSKAMKQYLATRRIHQVMIPGGCTSTLQGMDLVIMRPFKAALARQMEAFLNRPGAPRTPAGNPVKPALEEVCRWVREAWKGVSDEMVQTALERSYGLRTPNFARTAIYRHHLLGPVVRNLLEAEERVEELVAADFEGEGEVELA
mmetsp:Transcript_7143/g.12835  ORF Transcript_7143/g.12835 Transcript_7143/m.12835 type:complete len:261 (+) Transcript_7143:841-1623(+)